MKRIKSKIALVTGAGSGIGQATAIALAKKGAILILVDINESGMKQTANTISSLGGKTTSHVVDVTDLEAMKKLATSVNSIYGKVHIVVNNAGIGVLEDFADNELESFKKVIDVNMWGVIYGSKLFLPLMIDQREGHIVNISSLAGIISTPGMVSYGTSKFAVRGFSESLRAEIKHQNIGVTSVHPGMIRTNIAKTSECDDDNLQGKMVDWFEKWGRPPELVAKKIVRAIEKDQMRVLVTPETYIMDAMKRLAPTVSEEIAGRLMTSFRKLVSPDYGKPKDNYDLEKQPRKSA